MDDLDLVAEIGQHFRRGKRPAIAALPGLREEARARQQHRYLKRLILRVHDRRRGECRSGNAAHERAAIDF